MAVNDNDRVTTRRLKQFWDIAKPWIQTLVSGSIDTSEEEMESSMDAKILAAKPNYRMPNTDNQIGVGYGYNDVVKYYKSLSSYDIFTWTNIKDLFSSSTGFGPQGDALQRNMTYLNQQTGASNLPELKQHFLQMMEGKLSIIPEGAAPLITDLDLSVDEIPDEYFNSTYDGSALVSPVYTYNGHKYQTKLVGLPDTNANFEYQRKIDDGEFERPNVASSTKIFIASLDWYNPLCDRLAGYIPSSSVTTEKLADNSVSSSKIKEGAINAPKKMTTMMKPIPLCKSFNSTNVMCKAFYGLNRSSMRYDFFGAVISGNYQEMLNNEQSVTPKLYYENDNTRWIAKASYTFGLDGAFNESASIQFRTQIGYAHLKTDNGLYFTPVKSVVESVDNLSITPVDPDFITHLNEANPELTINIPIEPMTMYRLSDV